MFMNQKSQSRSIKISLQMLKKAKNKLIIIIFLLTLSGCTYSVVINQSKGETSDLVEENQSPTADVKSDINASLTP
jgi:hypothetical protein